MYLTHLIVVSLGVVTVSSSPLTPKFSIDFEIEKLRQLENFLNNSSSFGNDDVLTAEINDYADRMFDNLGGFMKRSNIDPMAMPEISEKIKHLLVTGEFTLFDGHLSDISTLHREGDCIVSFDKKKNYLTVQIPMGFQDLSFDYKYKVKILAIGPTGNVTGNVLKFKMGVTIGIDFNTYMGYLEQYKVTQFGKMSMHFQGNLVYDWLLDLMTTSATTALQPVIKQLIQFLVRDTLQHLIGSVNEIVQKILI